MTLLLYWTEYIHTEPVYITSKVIEPGGRKRMRNPPGHDGGQPYEGSVTFSADDHRLAEAATSVIQIVTLPPEPTLQPPSGCSLGITPLCGRGYAGCWMRASENTASAVVVLVLPHVPIVSLAIYRWGARTRSSASPNGSQTSTWSRVT